VRTYIFTERERRVIGGWLGGAEVSTTDVAKIKHRVKAFKELEADVDLYLKFRERVRQVSSSR